MTPALWPEHLMGSTEREGRPQRGASEKQQGSGQTKQRLTKTKRPILTHLGLECGLPGSPCPPSPQEGSVDSVCPHPAAPPPCL